MRLIGIVAILAFLPLCIAWLQAGAFQRRTAYVALGILPFTIDTLNLDVALVDWAMWPGYVKGVVLSGLDMLALAIVITHRKPRMPTALLATFGIYLVAVAASILVANIWIASTFYVFQLARILLLVFAVAAVAQDPRAVRYIGLGLALAIIMQAGVSLYERAQGVTQASGTMSHQNLLGMMTHFVLFPLLGLIFAGERSKVIALGACAAVVAIALSGSRATIGLAAVGIVLLAVLSLARKVTAKKLRIVGGGAILVAFAGVAAAATLSQRLGKSDTASSNTERVAFERAASLMIDDHPFGVGANQYVIVANSGGYSQQAQVNWNEGSRSANVHNFYLLTMAELGIMGAVAAVLLLIAAIGLSFREAWASRRHPVSEVSLGIAVALTVVALHNIFEWIFVTSEVQSVFAISLGMVAGLGAARRAAMTRDGRRSRNRTAAASPRADAELDDARQLYPSPAPRGNYRA